MIMVAGLPTALAGTGAISNGYARRRQQKERSDLYAYIACQSAIVLRRSKVLLLPDPLLSDLPTLRAPTIRHAETMAGRTEKTNKTLACVACRFQARSRWLDPFSIRNVACGGVINGDGSGVCTLAS